MIASFKISVSISFIKLRLMGGSLGTPRPMQDILGSNFIYYCLVSSGARSVLLVVPRLLPSCCCFKGLSCAIYLRYWATLVVVIMVIALLHVAGLHKGLTGIGCGFIVIFLLCADCYLLFIIVGWVGGLGGVRGGMEGRYSLGGW